MTNNNIRFILLHLCLNFKVTRYLDYVFYSIKTIQTFKCDFFYEHLKCIRKHFINKPRFAYNGYPNVTIESLFFKLIIMYN